MADCIYRLPPWRRSSQVFTQLSPAERDWGLNQFQVPDVWKVTRGAGIRVAVLDTGCDESHPELQGQVINSRDFTNSPYGSTDVQSHGTHCAGIIAARENDQGIVGICPDLAQQGGGLLVGKVLGDDGSGRGSWISAGIQWAVASRAQIISMSLGSSFPDNEIYRAVKWASDAGVFVICAAGNDGGGGTREDRVNNPARYRETIAVGAVGRDQLIADFSSRGPAVDIAAPGENILSTVPNNSYVRMSGTSMACPFVAAVVALAISQQSIEGVDQLRQLLVENAEDAGTPGKDSDYGAGLIRPDRMVVPTTPPDGNPDWRQLIPTVHIPARVGDDIGLKFERGTTTPPDPQK